MSIVASQVSNEGNLFEHASSEPAGKLDQILECDLRVDTLTYAYRLVPAPPRTGEKGMDAGQAAAVADRNAAEGVELARGRYQAAVAGFARVSLIEKQWIAVSRGVRPMANRIAHHLGQIGWLVDGDLLPDFGAKAFKFRFGGGPMFG